jgi:signal transduction histidine kinase
VKFTSAQAQPRISIGARVEKGEAICYIRDNGIGISPKYHEKIFDVFEKLDRGTEGSGVGLAIVRRIVETHGGRIWVQSQGENQGATFLFALPLADAQQGKSM